MKRMKRISVAVNDLGLRVGEDHPNAKLSDAEVEMVRKLHEMGMSYALIAEKFESSIHTIGKICRYQRRAQWAVRKKTIFVSEE
jgi:DNA invertase Pin-like site-specific DNA recombinase